MPKIGSFEGFVIEGNSFAISTVSSKSA